MTWVLLAVVVVLVVIIGVLVARQQQSRRLKDEFGRSTAASSLSAVTSVPPRRSWPIAGSGLASSRSGILTPAPGSATWSSGRRLSVTS